MLTTSRRYFQSHLVSLPQELIDAIIDLITDPVDILNLGLTCSFLFRLLAPRLRDIIVADEAPWAGDRIILIGQSAIGVPPTLDADLEELTSRAMAVTEQYANSTPHNNSVKFEYARRNPLFTVKAMRVTDGNESDEEHRPYTNPHIRSAAWMHVRHLKRNRLEDVDCALLDRLFRSSSNGTARNPILRCMEMK
jgi:hypothetical protein